jgi:hypothetical protein
VQNELQRILVSRVKYIFNSALPKMPKKVNHVAQENFLTVQKSPRDHGLKVKDLFNSALPTMSKKFILVSGENFLTIRNDEKNRQEL